MRSTVWFAILFLFLQACQLDTSQKNKQELDLATRPSADTSLVDQQQRGQQALEKLVKKDTIDYDTSQWTELIRLDTSILLDMRYATDSNFVGQQLYNCARCFLRPQAAQALLKVHQELKREGLGLVLFDCYRPRAVQWKLWEIYPKPGYVADPRKGSIHNRGAAVDLSIVDSVGQLLDMGTDFDFFGPQANHHYANLPKAVLQNRQKLKQLMQKHGFSAIRSEWWHYNYRGKRYELADKEWPCSCKLTEVAH